jgi:hypothetical protein
MLSTIGDTHEATIKEGGRRDCRHLGIVSSYLEQKEEKNLAGMKKQLYLCSVKNDSLVSLS